MLTTWLRERWAQRQERRALARRAIPDVTWRRTLRRFPFLVEGTGRDEDRLRRMTSLFLDQKEFSGAHGLKVTDDMAVAIAAQACLPVLHLGLGLYSNFVGIVVHPGAARVYRERVGHDGVVHAGDEELAGEAHHGGPVMLSWRDVRASGASAPRGYNVVIHEFAHVIDMANGDADGHPPLPAEIDAAEWAETFSAEFERFSVRVDAYEPTAMDAYASQGPDEFFAVATEAFFVNREAFAQEHPALDALLARFYRHPPLPAAAPGPAEDTAGEPAMDQANPTLASETTNPGQGRGSTDG
jgi:Mlc titration factor MtfA (ptsG expression regulator)